MKSVGDDFVFPFERRSRMDRRRHPKFPPLFSSYSRRRRWGRRSTDQGGYVDLYDLRTWGVALSVMALSILDGLLTSLQITAGRIQEANPLMAHFLEVGGSPFFIACKATLTALALALIVMHKEWRIARHAARLCLWFYILIAIYHLYLIFGWPHISLH